MKLKDLEVARYKLEKGGQVTIQSDGLEVYVHDLVSASRPNGVFSPPVCGFYHRNNGPLIIRASGSHRDFLVASVPCEGSTRGSLVSPKLHEIGWGHHKRAVWEILGGNGPSERLRCGETRNEKGSWSSWPPHSFDHDLSRYAEFEEIFVPFMRPSGGFAVIRRKGVCYLGFDYDDALVLESGVMVSVPLGKHPIVAAPETDLVYVWFYLSPEPKVYAKWAEDVGCYK